MSADRWTPRDIPDMGGKIVVVTGANSGIGYEAARALAKKGAHVLLGCRSESAANAAMEKIRAEHSSASLAFLKLDLADLASVRAAAAAFGDKHDRLDVLINNAGVMALPYRKTADGFEMQFGTNHLGHFALTGLLLPRIVGAPAGRVVTVSSAAHQMGKIRFDDLQGEHSYSAWLAYGQSKLANLLFTYELSRRLAARGLGVRSVACHPGYASTNLQSGASRMAGSSFGERFWGVVNKLFAQSTEAGAWPTLFAATSEEARSGDYIGPTTVPGLYGTPARVKSNRASRDEAVAARLWDVSEQLTGVSYASVLGGS